MSAQSSASPSTSNEQPSSQPDQREEPSLADWATRSARENPVLAVGAAVAVGALAALAVRSLKAPPTRARSLEKQLSRQLTAMERALQRDRPLSTLADRLADTSAAITSRVASWDRGTIDDLLRRASDMTARFARGRG